jgi:glucose-6-phosphate 1-dehydrogenase
LDVLRGDTTLFTRSDELEAAWRFITPVLDYWENSRAQPEPYPAGTWGPEAAEALLARTGRRWHVPTL